MSQDDVLTLTLAKPADAPIGVTLQSHGDGESSATLPTVIAVRSDGAAAALFLVGDTLLSINGEAVSTFAAAKESLQAGAKAATAANPFIELVWQRGAEEGVPAAQFSSQVQRWNLLQWSVP